MTLEELTELKSRIAKAELHKTRIDRLQDALVKLSDVSQLRLAVQGSLPTIQYATSLTPEPSWTRVCWAEQEKGLAEDIVAAVREIIQRRIADATNQFEEQ